MKPHTGQTAGRQSSKLGIFSDFLDACCRRENSDTNRMGAQDKATPEDPDTKRTGGLPGTPSCPEYKIINR